MRKALVVMAVLAGFAVDHTERIVRNNKRFLITLLVTFGVSETLTIILVHSHRWVKTSVLGEAPIRCLLPRPTTQPLRSR